MSWLELQREQGPLSCSWTCGGVGRRGNPSRTSRAQGVEAEWPRAGRDRGAPRNQRVSPAQLWANGWRVGTSPGVPHHPEGPGPRLGFRCRGTEAHNPQKGREFVSYSLGGGSCLEYRRK